MLNLDSCETRPIDSGSGHLKSQKRPACDPDLGLWQAKATEARCGHHSVLSYFRTAKILVLASAGAVFWKVFTDQADL